MKANKTTQPLKQVLFVLHYPVYGGPHNQVVRLNAEITERGWQFVVLLPCEPGNAADRLRAAGTRVVTTDLHRVRARLDPRLAVAYAANFAGDVRRIQYLIRQLNIDLVIVGGLVNPQGAIAAKLENVPLIWNIVDSRAPKLLRLLTMPLVRRLSDLVMFDGKALEVMHVGRRPLPVPSRVFFPPVDTAKFRPDRARGAEVRQALGIAADDLVVGTVANVNPQKGLEYFVDAASLIHKCNPSVHFLVVGAHYETHREYSRRLKGMVADKALPPNLFQFLGERTNVEDFYNAMDIKLITSVPNSEGTTTTAMEAMACGLPVVATDVGGIREVVMEGETGTLVRARDARALADATLRLLADQAGRASMGREGRRRAEELYDLKHSAQTQVDAFELAVARGGISR